MPAARKSKLLEWFWQVHRGVYRASGGRLGSQVFGIPVLLLTTRGRVTGRPRDVMLHYLRRLKGYVVIASYAGDLRNPSWYLNLMANPKAVVQVGSKSLEVVAREATGEEREMLWSKAVELDPSYTEYQRRTERKIPLVILDPVEEVAESRGA